MKYVCTHCKISCTFDPGLMTTLFPTKCPFKGAGYWIPEEGDEPEKPDKKGVNNATD